MATSGTYSFNLVKTQIITRAYQLSNQVPLNGSPTSEEYSFASDILNMMMKTMENNGCNLWKRRQATLFPTTNQYAYQIGNVTGADNTTNSYVNTTVAASVASSSNAVQVTSTTGFTTGMFVGLEQDDNSRIWGTISSIVGSTLNCTFTTTTTSASGNTVVAYTTKINRPLDILRATNCDLKNNNNETQLQMISYDDYFNMPIKSSPGRPSNFYYDRTLNNSLPYTGTLYLFNQPNLSSVVINFTYQDSIQDMINATDSPDFPQEWTMTLTYLLSVELCRLFGKKDRLDLLQPQALQLLNQATQFDTDSASMRFMPNMEQYRSRL